MIFVVFGGSGSSFLVKSLHCCHRRPDIGFIPWFWSTEPNIFQQIIPKDQIYTVKPTRKGITAFFSRTCSGFRMNPHISVGHNLIDYIKGSKRIHTVLVWSAFYGLFSKYRIRDVVFIFRHPIHCYCSWTKKDRHREYVAPLGGVNSEKSVKFFARIWNGLANEYNRLVSLDCSPILIRYENPRTSFDSLPQDVVRVFDEWNGSKRNDGLLKPEFEKLMMKLTCNNFQRIYS